MSVDNVNQDKIFWDQLFSRVPDIEEPTGEILTALQAAQQYFGQFAGKTLLDLGAGRGESSVFFARLGAHVISVDQSDTAMRNLAAYCQRHGLNNVRTVVADLFEIQNLGPVDYVFGSMVLHHVEPFEPFVELVRSVLAGDGRAFFFENNGASDFLLWFRTHLVGRMGIPKLGDQTESPLSPAEVGVLRRHFEVKQEFPYLYFFRLVSIYFFRSRLLPLFTSLDQWTYRIAALRKFSYQQYLFLTSKANVHDAYSAGR